MTREHHFVSSRGRANSQTRHAYGQARSPNHTYMCMHLYTWWAKPNPNTRGIVGDPRAICEVAAAIRACMQSAESDILTIHSCMFFPVQPCEQRGYTSLIVTAKYWSILKFYEFKKLLLHSKNFQKRCIAI